MSIDRPRATIIELLQNFAGEPIHHRERFFFICTAKEDPELIGPFDDYCQAEDNSLHNYKLLEANEVHPDIWMVSETEEWSEAAGEVEMEQGIYFDVETGIGVWEAVVWVKGSRVPDEQQPRKRFWIRQRGNSAVLGMERSTNDAIASAEVKAAKVREQRSEEMVTRVAKPSGRRKRS